MVRKGGSVVSVGRPDGPCAEPLPFKYIVHNEIAIYGSRANPNVSRKIINMIGAEGALEEVDDWSRTPSRWRILRPRSTPS